MGGSSELSQLRSCVPVIPTSISGPLTPQQLSAPFLNPLMKCDSPAYQPRFLDVSTVVNMLQTFQNRQLEVQIVTAAGLRIPLSPPSPSEKQNSNNEDQPVNENEDRAISPISAHIVNSNITNLQPEAPVIVTPQTLTNQMLSVLSNEAIRSDTPEGIIPNENDSAIRPLLDIIVKPKTVGKDDFPLDEILEELKDFNEYRRKIYQTKNRRLRHCLKKNAKEIGNFLNKVLDKGNFTEAQKKEKYINFLKPIWNSRGATPPSSPPPQQRQQFVCSKCREVFYEKEHLTSHKNVRHRVGSGMFPRNNKNINQ